MLSIIMPVYNSAEYLQESVASVLNQTYQDFELIMIDDGSSDGSGELCDRFAEADARIRVIHKTNHGVAAARNTGLNYVRGDYIGWVDSDDIISPVMYEILMKLAEENEADIAQCDHVRTPEKLDMVGLVYEPTILCSLDSLKRIYNSHYTNIMSLWSKIYRKKLFDDLRFTEGSAFEDDEIVPVLLEKAEKCVFIEAPLYCYLKRNNSIITTSSIKNIMALTVHLEHRMLHFQKIDNELYLLSKKHFFTYIKQKFCQKEFQNTDVQKQAYVYIRKYYKQMFREACNAEKCALILVRCSKVGKHIVIKTDFEPVQKLIGMLR